MTDITLSTNSNAVITPVVRHLKPYISSIVHHELSFNQVIPNLIILSNTQADCPTPHLLLNWVDLDAVSPTFAAFLQGKPSKLTAILEEIEAYCTHLERAASTLTQVFLPLFILHPRWGLNTSETISGALCPKEIIDTANSLLLNKYKQSSTITLINLSPLLHDDFFNPKLWYSAKLAYSNQIFKGVAERISAFLLNQAGKEKKAIILDLDDTLWGGILGDAGKENLVLGPSSPKGEAYQDFQKCLYRLKERGIILALCSKNEEAIALEAINSHDHMILSENDFSAWRINWDDKATNIKEIAKELNLGLQSLIFLDDNPSERDRVASALPEVLVPDLPKDPMKYVSTLSSLDVFNFSTSSGEDQQRTQLYKEEKKRQESAQILSIDEWLHSLEMKIYLAPLKASNEARFIQLMNKTNQMNLTTRRETSASLKNWLNNGRREMWGLSLEDKFGKSGLVAGLGFEQSKETLNITDFFVSCRVFNKGVEECLLHLLTLRARDANASTITATYIPTQKNSPCYDKFKMLWNEKKPFAFELPIEKYSTLPKHISSFTIEVDNDA
ncbi:HAD-IIIC family phosphatase [Temperatibacter marinus]|uniref:HAD-IIIC family phosphatase n=1 Tax=Temperatibacter marinus TaxID=1456591 RepID=A0AA52EBK5_9PROT|nr:HAD-IIIC family phosphatase [Temperatibacter marinus]WND01710.1 HAD-IIIC family phosphatase [Temperatibacter marinus]